jgi:hypothetical protein
MRCGGQNVAANEVELRGGQLICHHSPRKNQVPAQDKTSPQSSEITRRVGALKRNGLDTSKECAYKVIGQADAIWEQGKQVEEENLLIHNKFGDIGDMNCDWPRVPMTPQLNARVEPCKRKRVRKFRVNRSWWWCRRLTMSLEMREEGFVDKIWIPKVGVIQTRRKRVERAA